MAEPSEDRVEELAEVLFVAWHPANTVERWRSPQAFVDRERFRRQARAVLGMKSKRRRKSGDG